MVQKIQMPEKLDWALEGLVRAVLLHQPEDIYLFAAGHFEKILRSRADDKDYAQSQSNSKLSQIPDVPITINPPAVFENNTANNDSDDDRADDRTERPVDTTDSDENRPENTTASEKDIISTEKDSDSELKQNDPEEEPITRAKREIDESLEDLSKSTNNLEDDIEDCNELKESEIDENAVIDEPVAEEKTSSNHTQAISQEPQVLSVTADYDNTGTEINKIESDGSKTIENIETGEKLNGISADAVADNFEGPNGIGEIESGDGAENLDTSIREPDPADLSIDSNSVIFEKDEQVTAENKADESVIEDETKGKTEPPEINESECLNTIYSETSIEPLVRMNAEKDGQLVSNEESSEPTAFSDNNNDPKVVDSETNEEVSPPLATSDELENLNDEVDLENISGTEEIDLNEENKDTTKEIETNFENSFEEIVTGIEDGTENPFREIVISGDEQEPNEFLEIITAESGNLIESKNQPSEKVSLDSEDSNKEAKEPQNQLEESGGDGVETVPENEILESSDLESISVEAEKSQELQPDNGRNKTGEIESNGNRETPSHLAEAGQTVNASEIQQSEIKLDTDDSTQQEAQVLGESEEDADPLYSNANGENSVPTLEQISSEDVVTEANADAISSDETNEDAVPLGSNPDGENPAPIQKQVSREDVTTEATADTKSSNENDEDVVPLYPDPDGESPAPVQEQISSEGVALETAVEENSSIESKTSDLKNGEEVEEESSGTNDVDMQPSSDADKEEAPYTVKTDFLRSSGEFHDMIVVLPDGAGNLEVEKELSGDERESEDQCLTSEVPKDSLENISDPETEAAIKIQAAYRGYTVRKDRKKNQAQTDTLTEPDNIDLEPNPTREEDSPDAVPNGELSVSNTDLEKENDGTDENRRNAAATVIQASYRGYATRKDLRSTRGEVEDLTNNSKENENDIENRSDESKLSSDNDRNQNLDEAASVIQAAFRGYVDRKKIAQFHKAATTIQANYRGYKVRNPLKISKGVDAP